jgi:hypothetical protein
MLRIVVPWSRWHRLAKDNREYSCRVLKRDYVSMSYINLCKVRPTSRSHILTSSFDANNKRRCGVVDALALYNTLELLATMTIFSFNMYIVTLLLALYLGLPFASASFVATPSICFQLRAKSRLKTMHQQLLSRGLPQYISKPQKVAVSTTPYAASTTTTDTETSDRPPCFYKSPQGRWQPRIDYLDLTIGEAMTATVFQPLFEGKTGPKLWVDVGAGRYSAATKSWSIQTAMLRLPMRKMSVARKKAQQLAKQDSFEVYVSRILPENNLLEVSLYPIDSTTMVSVPVYKPVSSLTIGQSVNCTVEKICDYGVLVRIDGINRHGLLPIRQVGRLLGRFVAGKEGLQDKATAGGFSPRMRLQLQVSEIKGKRLLLDFTDETYQEKENENEYKTKQRERKTEGETGTDIDEDSYNSSAKMRTTKSSERLAVSPTSASSATLDKTVGSSAASTVQKNTVAVNKGTVNDEEEDDDNEDSDYDEDRDIEDALGLGYY